METISHHGRTTPYRVAGSLDSDGPTVLAVHGSGGSHRLWAPQYAPSGCRPIVVPDLSGHAGADDIETEPGPETLTAYVQDVTVVARVTDADVLVGNSLGGAVVLQVLLDGTYDPAGAILLGSGAKLAVHEQLREWLAEDFERTVEFLHGEDLLFHDAPAELLERSQSQMRATGRAVTERDFLTCHRFDVRDRLGEIETPLLALVGEHDQLTPIDYHEYLAEDVQNGRLSVIDDAAHLAMLERPAAVNEAIREFAREVGDNRRRQ